MKIETEKKYYCMEPEKLIQIAESLKFKCLKSQIEVDEYFTDIDSEFIKNRTCLRIRKTDNKDMEITYKGKSNDLSGIFCKFENNIKLEISEYDNFIKLLSSLGYYSYVEVMKERITYELITDKYKYSIMIDKIPEIGGFVEFEIISDQSNSKRNELKKELENFIQKFLVLNLKEANLPYRDIVANHIYDNLILKKEKNSIYINIDNELSKYEKLFFKQYKNKISEVCSKNIKWGIYKKDKSIELKIQSLIDEYMDNLVFDNSSLLVAINLLYKLKQKKYFLTKINKNFFYSFFKKLKINIDDVIFLNNESITDYIHKNRDKKNSIIVCNKSLKEINSILLIIINVGEIKK